jgi:hypothetical protein
MDGIHAREIHDAAPALRHHPRQAGLGEPDGGFEVHRHDAAIILLGEVQELVGGAQGRVVH